MNGGYKNMKRIFATPLTANDSVAKEQLGCLRREWSATDSCYKTYRYVQAASDTTVANGTALGFVAADLTQTSVSSDADDFYLDMVAGVGIGAITASYYGWIQTHGYHSVVKTNADDDIAAGVKLILCSTDGTVDSMAANTASTNTVVGIAVAADVDANDTVAAYLTVAE